MVDPVATGAIRLDPEVKAGLTALAQATRRSRSFLAAEAVAAHVAREASITAGIE
jgi:predicted transcriptional regulator